MPFLGALIDYALRPVSAIEQSVIARKFIFEGKSKMVLTNTNRRSQAWFRMQLEHSVVSLRSAHIIFLSDCTSQVIVWDELLPTQVRSLFVSLNLFDWLLQNL